MMTSKIESLVPPSPERNGQLHRSSSRESLTAHPLLSPGSSSLNVSSSSASPDSNITRIASPSSVSAATAPKYLPYTPRHRVPTGTVSTGTAVSSPVSAVPVTPLQQHGTYPGATNVSATSKLQLQNLKAIAQNHGLDASCLGWAILEEIVLGSDHGGPAWNDIWNALTVGKVSDNSSLSTHLVFGVIDKVVFDLIGWSCYVGDYSPPFGASERTRVYNSGVP